MIDRSEANYLHHFCLRMVQGGVVGGIGICTVGAVLGNAELIAYGGAALIVGILGWGSVYDFVLTLPRTVPNDQGRREAK